MNGVDSTTVAKRVIRASTITGLSVQTDMAENPVTGNDYKLSIRKNGVTAADEIAFVALPKGSIGSQDGTLAVAVVAGDILYAFMERTAGGGASVFGRTSAEVELVG
jgi:hypothetical protein